MHRFGSIFLISFGLSACDAVVLRQPQIQNLNQQAGTSTVSFDITEVQMTEEVALNANQIPFRELVVVSDNPASPSRLLSPSDAIRRNPPPHNFKVEYTLGVGDVLKLDRLNFVINADGIESEEIITRQLSIEEGGYVALADGRRVTVLGLTIEQARQALANALAETTNRLASHVDEIPLPVLDVPAYLVGVGDVLTVSRLIRTSEAGEFTETVVTQATRVNSNGLINILDIGAIEVLGLNLEELTETISQEALRAGLASEIIVEVRDFNSQSAMVTGDLGTRLVPITSEPLTIDRLLAGINPNLSRDRDYIVRVERGVDTFQMRARRILLEEARDKYPILDGDRITIERLAQLPSFQLSVAEFNSQIVSFTIVGETAVNELILNDQGLDIRQLIGRAGKQISRNEDGLIRVIRNREEYRLSLQDVLLERPDIRYWLQSGDHVIIEDLVYSRNTALVFGAVGRPQRLPLSAAQRTTLSEALFNGPSQPSRDADFGHIYVLRNNSEQYAAYHLDLLDVSRVRIAEIFELRPGDIVFVSKRPISKLNEILQLSLGLVSSTAALGSIADTTPDSTTRSLE